MYELQLIFLKNRGNQYSANVNILLNNNITRLYIIYTISDKHHFNQHLLMTPNKKGTLTLKEIHCLDAIDYGHALHSNKTKGNCTQIIYILLSLSYLR